MIYLALVRQERGLGQKVLAAAVARSQPWVALVESQEITPSKAQLLKLAEVLAWKGDPMTLLKEVKIK